MAVAPDGWDAYQAMNRRFAQTLTRLARTGDRLWVQDYPLIPLAGQLRQLGGEMELVLFLHAAFPSPDLFLRMPWCQSLLSGLLAFDRLGFQTSDDLTSFLACARRLQPEVKMLGARTLLVQRQGGAHSVELTVHPAGVDAEGLAAHAARPEIVQGAEELRSRWGDRKLVVAIDPLEPFQGIPVKLAAFAAMLERSAELRGQVSLLEIVVPSRHSIPGAAGLKAEIERRIGEINGRLGTPGWVPIVYQNREPGEKERLILYRAADLALVTPLREGSGLTAKEYCAIADESRGALVLSEFSGAAARMAGALRVNPYSLEALADAIAQGLALSSEERRSRLGRLQRQVQRRDVFWWADSAFAEPGTTLDPQGAQAVFGSSALGRTLARSKPQSGAGTAIYVQSRARPTRNDLNSPRARST